MQGGNYKRVFCRPRNPQFSFNLGGFVIKNDWPPQFPGFNEGLLDNLESTRTHPTSIVGVNVLGYVVAKFSDRVMPGKEKSAFQTLFHLLFK